MRRYSSGFLSLLFILSASTAVRAQAACGPSSLGQPCAQGGIAAVSGNEPGLNLGAGNPIHLITGNKYQQEPDLPANPASPRLEIVRHYNALDRRASALGRGWVLSYDTRLFRAAGRWQIVQADGSRITFDGSGNAGDLAQATRHGRLHTAGSQRVWTWPTGQTLTFDAQGRLIQIDFPRGDTLAIRRNSQAGPLSGSISQIVDAQGKTLSFHYRLVHRHAYLTRIDSPSGLFQYDYEPASAQADPDTTLNALRLTTVTRPDGMQRRYLYEPRYQAGNPYHLTGIEIVSADRRHRERINSWAYDPQGRAIRSIQGSPDQTTNKLSIQYLSRPDKEHNGTTVVTGPTGHKTRFLTALKGGRHVLLRVSGAVCPGCAAPGSNASYDDQGRLTGINGTLIDRDALGSVQALRPLVFGWPGLVLRYAANGRRESWDSALTHTERTVYNDRQQPTQRLFANGDRWQYHYDSGGRPIEMIEKNARATTKTALSWQGNLLMRVEHPHETESRHYDQHQRLIRRRVDRRPANGGARVRYTDAFDYDQHHRLTQHNLPEGGSLRYQWGRGNRLIAIVWHDRQGRAHPVIDSTPGQAGYRYGNGLRLQVALAGRQAGQLRVVNAAGAPLWTQRHTYDRRGLLQREQHHIPSKNHTETWHYAHNADAQLTGAQTEQGDPIWYAWQNGGALAAQRIQGNTIKPAIARDPSGLPESAQGYRLRYGPNRRLIQVHRDGKPLDTYRHNAYGQRIAKQSPRARTDYFYLDNRIVAESRRPGATPRHSGFAVTRRYVYAHHVLVGVIDYGPTAHLYAVHSDLIGAPRLMTDENQKIRWAAAYSPTGAATRLAGDLTLDLRLPGQIVDATTGWHDNLLRTYLPALGHYLEPDPLGPVPGNQALGYARQQPKRYVDPLGLLLFAFDGTRSNPQTQTNVWKMSQHYQDGPVFYHSGPGAPGQIDWDAIAAYSAPDIVEAQWQSLLTELDRPMDQRDTVPIDIIGFSRGAALARHFGNLINGHVSQGLFSYTDTVRGLITACVDLRFMGLFDTVAQFGLLGAQNTNYDLTIASAWEWVAHAVALQERRWLYPLTSAADNLGQNTIEAPFIGAHSDIGGGVSFDDAGNRSSRGDLSDVALNWMLWQARAASLRFSTANAADREISDPVLHDQRAPLIRSAQNGDRRIDAADGSPLHNYQDHHARLGRRQRDDTEKLIERIENWRRSDTAEVGAIDMNGYAQWLHDELGWQPLPV